MIQVHVKYTVQIPKLASNFLKVSPGLTSRMIKRLAKLRFMASCQQAEPSVLARRAEVEARHHPLEKGGPSAGHVPGRALEPG